MNKTLVVAEAAKGKLIPGTLAAITAAAKCGFPVTAIIAGDNTKEIAAELSKVNGVANVLTLTNPALANVTAADVVPSLLNIIKEEKFTHVLAASTAQGRDIIPRLAGKLDVMPISDIMDVVDPATFKRGTYAGNAVTTVKSSDALKLMTVRTASFDKAATDRSDAAAIAESKASVTPSPTTKWVKDVVEVSDKPDLTAASIIISGGRGLKDGNNFKLLFDLAKPLKAAVGATRAVVDAGYVPNDMQIGQTGKIVAPQLYIAVGLSGAIQHVAGMKDSKVIACINTDPEAPIFGISDYGLVADLFEAVPKMTELVSK
jgi:electron transfer flavoprotein alpha subunit